MTGVVIALVAALAWACSSTILKYLSSRIDAITVNAIRLWVGSIIIVSLILLSGHNANILQTHLWSILLVAASGILSAAIGDTIYIRSLSYLDVSRAYPISQSMFPVATLILAVFLLNESFTWFNILGMAIILAGILMIVSNSRTSQMRKISVKGIALALLAALLWAIGATVLKFGLQEVDPYLAVAIRNVTSALILTGLVYKLKSADGLNLKRFNTRTLILVVLAGLLTYGIGATGYVMAIHLIGAGKTVFLGATAPIFLLPLSVLFLKERLSPLALAGVLAAIAGICLIAL